MAEPGGDIDMRTQHSLAAILLAVAAQLSPMAATISQARVDPGFSYQGELRLSGVPIAGDHDFRFSLYVDETGGSPVGPTLARDAVSVSDGVFSVFLDFGSAPLASQPRFLEIEVRASGSGSFQTLTPRTRLSTTPYAWAAAVTLADSVDGDSIVDGSVGADEIDVSQVQRRVANACPSGQFMRAVDEQGTAVCDSASGGGSAWSLSGNSGTDATNNYVGTSDNQALVIGSNGQAVGWFEAVALSDPADFTANIRLGSPNNVLQAGVRGATISGGGVPATVPGSIANPNRVTDDFGTVGGGQDNVAGNDDGSTANHPWATVGGGVDNIAGREASTVGGGKTNQVVAVNGTIAGGFNNFVRGSGATIGGGEQNRAGDETGSGTTSTISGGFNNTASGQDSAVAGGGFNSATGAQSMVSGGEENCAGGAYSWAGGRQAKVRPGVFSGEAGFGCSGVPLATVNSGDAGTFIWADSQDDEFVSSGENQFLVRAAGGIYFGDDSSVSLPGGRFINTSTGAHLTTGGAWTNSSSRALKAGFEAIDPAAVLARVLDLPLTRWFYRESPEEGEHLGPVAEDFHAAFGLGSSGDTISTVDANGVALAAIQGLNQRLEAENRALRERNAAQDEAILELRRELAELRGRIEPGESGVD